MNKRIKVLSLIFALLMVFTALSLNAYATDEVVTPETPVTPAPETPVTPAPENPGPETPVTPEPDIPVTPEPTQGENPDGDSGTVDTPTEGIDDSNVETPTTGGYVDDSDDDFYYYDEDEMANSIEDSAGSVSDYTNLYDTSDLNKEALEEEKWSDIVLDTSKNTTDVSDFSAIKDNTNSDDDSQWILYAGVVLIALSLIGILYFIIATATYKKKLKALKQRERSQRSSNQNRARDDYGDYGEFPTQNDYNKRYRERNRYATSGMGYAEKKRLKADTADIELPKKYRARH